MAKINKFIASYADAVADLEISSDATVPPKAVIYRFVRVFKQVDDARCEGMISYPLVEIILIAFLAILGNASTWMEIEEFGRAKEHWIKKFIKFSTRLSFIIITVNSSSLFQI